jgi:hypothetical protein
MQGRGGQAQKWLFSRLDLYPSWNESLLRDHPMCQGRLSGEPVKRYSADFKRLRANQLPNRAQADAIVEAEPIGQPAEGKEQLHPAAAERLYVYILAQAKAPPARGPPALQPAARRRGRAVLADQGHAVNGDRHDIAVGPRCGLDADLDSPRVS